jgi:hypothetical protein
MMNAECKVKSFPGGVCGEEHRGLASAIGWINLAGRDRLGL